MKRPLAVLLAALLSCSCAGRPARLSERVTLGDTPDRVRAVLGEPNRRFMKTTEGGSMEIWAYTLALPFFLVPVEEIERAVPAAQSVTGIRTDEAFRLIFRDGRVVAFEGRD